MLPPQEGRAQLGLQVPVTLYQAGDGAMNATLYFRPGEAHVVFVVPLLLNAPGTSPKRRLADL
jgi:hypothetical protein